MKHEECGGNNIFHGQMKWNKGEGLQRSRSKSSLLEPGAGTLMVDLCFYVIKARFAYRCEVAMAELLFEPKSGLQCAVDAWR